MSSSGRVGCYPGSFNPPTRAHLAIAELARERAGLERVELVLSRVALGKPLPAGPPFEARVDVIRTLTIRRPWLGVRVTDAQLLADIADGYDAIVMGTDKWSQVNDPAWYGDEQRRDLALSRLPTVIVAVRAGDVAPTPVPDRLIVVELDPNVATMSSTLARSGNPWAMADEAIRSGLW